MHGGGDDPTDGQGGARGHDGGGHVSLLFDFFPEIDGRQPDRERKCNHENQHAEAGEDQALRMGNSVIGCTNDP